MTNVLTCGWARGYRTYIMCGLAALTAIAAWSVGDANTADTLRALWELFLSGGVAATRAALD